MRGWRQNQKACCGDIGDLGGGGGGTVKCLTRVRIRVRVMINLSKLCSPRLRPHSACTPAMHNSRAYLPKISPTSRNRTPSSSRMECVSTFRASSIRKDLGALEESPLIVLAHLLFKFLRVPLQASLICSDANPPKSALPRWPSFRPTPSVPRHRAFLQWDDSYKYGNPWRQTLIFSKWQVACLVLVVVLLRASPYCLRPLICT